MDTSTIPSGSPISVSNESIRYSIEWSPKRTCVATRTQKLLDVVGCNQSRDVVGCV
jgi:hypothetical protein